MVRAIAGAFLVIALVPSAAGQAADSSSAHPSLVLHDGEPVVMRALQRVTSADAAIGQEIQFEVIKPVRAGNLIVISEQATAIAKVVAVERKRRMGRGGKLSIAIERVRLVDGEAVPLRAVIARSAGGKSEMAGDMASAFVLSYGLSLPLTPLFLLKHGNDMAVSPGDRFVAYVDGEVALNQDSITEAQRALVASSDIGTVYVFRDTKDSGNFPQISVVCGEALVGAFHQDQFVRMQLPTGLYWFRAGAASYKKIERVHQRDLFPLQVEAGSTYYLQVRAFRGSKWSVDWDAHLEKLSPQAGAEAVNAVNYRAESAIEQVGANNLDKLQKQATPAR